MDKITEITQQNDIFKDETIDVSKEANFIWSIANKLRGSYMPDKYGDVIIPMTIIRRFECVLEDTKEEVVEFNEENPTYPEKVLARKSGHQFFNTSHFDLGKLLNDPDNISSNFKSYINGFSTNVRNILSGLNMETQINKMDKDGCLYNVVKSFSELDLSIDNFDSIKMGYIFEDLIGRFFQNVEAGQFYTGRDIIKMMVSVLTAEGCDDVFAEGKVITILDQAAGTGGMLSTAHNYLNELNPSADIRLYGVEMMEVSHAVGLAEMLIKEQSSENFLLGDTLKEDPFKNQKMRFILENPPFGTPWKGANAKAGQENAVLAEHEKGLAGRWGAGLPSGGDSQLLFMQSAIDKMDDERGRAAIITNGSPLFNGNTGSGESQIRRWMLESDLIEAIIAMPTDLFYNTSIPTYVWILSKNKSGEREGKIQLIDARKIYHSLRKPLGNKRREFTREDRKKITELYVNFKENELSQIHDNTEFIYKEYTVMQPLQRSYAINEERIENLVNLGALNTFYDPMKFEELKLKEESAEDLTKADKNNLKKYRENEEIYFKILKRLEDNISESIYLHPDEFKPVLKNILSDLDLKTNVFNKILDGLSVMNKNAEIQKDSKGKIKYDKDTKDTEIININEDIDDYMQKEVLPHVPDAKAFFEEDLTLKNPRYKIGAEIPFTRCFYKYEEPKKSEDLAQEFLELEQSVNQRIEALFTEVSND